MAKSSWLTPAQERAWRALQFMQMRLDAELARRLAADSQLSYPDYIVLVALTDRPDGRLRLFELVNGPNGPDILNKSGILLYLRELSGLTSKQLTTALQSISASTASNGWGSWICKRPLS